MTIWLYCICRNEELILPYLLRHYSTFVDRMIFYDGNSTDSTRAILAANPRCECRNWPGSDELADDEFYEFANRQWKEARGHADWVIWIDADEFLYHPEIKTVLGQYKATGVQVPRIIGFTMVSKSLPTSPTQIYDEIKTGFFDPVWSKNVIFDPAIEMMWTMGRHGIEFCKVTPRLSEQADLKLLHYRCLGIDYLRARHRRNWDRVPERCRNINLGVNCDPEFTGNYGIKWFESVADLPFPNVI